VDELTVNVIYSITIILIIVVLILIGIMLLRRPSPNERTLPLVEKR